MRTPLLITGLLAATLAAGTAHAENDCKSLNELAERDGIPVPGSASGRQVIGKGRLPFYSAPHAHCKMAGVFVVPGDNLHAHVEHAGFTSVMYLNPATGSEALGWVASDRLKVNGTGIAPIQ